MWLLLLIAVLDALLGTALGLLASAFARTEFQAVQFMPAIVMPQVLLCGLFAPREQMTPVLEWLSNVMPLSYAVDALAAGHPVVRCGRRRSSATWSSSPAARCSRWSSAPRRCAAARREPAENTHSNGSRSVGS